MKAKTKSKAGTMNFQPKIINPDINPIPIELKDYNFGVVIAQSASTEYSGNTFGSFEVIDDEFEVTQEFIGEMKKIEKEPIIHVKDLRKHFED